jgi:hypothetical protein
MLKKKLKKDVFIVGGGDMGITGEKPAAARKSGRTVCG